MKTFKVLSLALATAALLTACTKETHTYEPGKPAGKYDVYFATSNPATQILGLTQDKMPIYLERTDASGELTVPVEIWTSEEGLLACPASVKFESGETEAVLYIDVKDFDPFVNHQANIKIPEEYTSPYKDEKHYPQCGFVFYKEDYKVIETGSYYDYFWYEEYWDQPLEYSELLKQYRLMDLWSEGAGFTFTWDGASKVTLQKAAIVTGIVHSSYGAITATPVSASYNEKGGYLQFNFNWTVSAGSFGTYPNYYFLAK